MSPVAEQIPTPSGHGEAAASTLTLEVENVTRTRSLSATFQSGVAAGAAAAALASRLSMPANVPYALRRSRTAAFLDDRAPLGSQVETGEKVTLTPKAHLG